LDGFTP